MSSESDGADLLAIVDRVVAQAVPGEQLEAFVSRGGDTEVRIYEGEVEHFVSAQARRFRTKSLDHEELRRMTLGLEKNLCNRKPVSEEPCERQVIAVNLEDSAGVPMKAPSPLAQL